MIRIGAHDSRPQNSSIDCETHDRPFRAGEFSDDCQTERACKAHMDQQHILYARTPNAVIIYHGGLMLVREQLPHHRMHEPHKLPLTLLPHWTRAKQLPSTIGPLIQTSLIPKEISRLPNTTEQPPYKHPLTASSRQLHGNC